MRHLVTLHVKLLKIVNRKANIVFYCHYQYYTLYITVCVSYAFI